MSFAGIVLLVSMMSALSILLLTPVAERFGLVDAPNSHRKFHDGHIPLVGGVDLCGAGFRHLPVCDAQR